MDNKTRCVDYGRDIAELANVVQKLSYEVVSLSTIVEALRRQLELQGTLYGGAVAYTVAIGQPQTFKYYNNKGEVI